MEESLRQVLQVDDRIAYALLFGSAARGDTTSFSDVDVAIGLRSGVKFDLHDIGGLVSELERAAGRDVDVVILDEAPPGLAYRVFRDGRCSARRPPSVLRRQVDWACGQCAALGKTIGSTN